jgi:ATP-dependent protease ClpP protease subunit
MPDQMICGTWYSIKALAGKTAHIHVHGEIGLDVSASALVEDIASLDTGDISVSINSPGGDAAAGLAIFNALLAHPATVTTTCTGMAASAASIVFMAGDKRVMAQGSLLMIHAAWGLAVGPSADMRAGADLLDLMSGSLASIYASRAGGDATDWLTLMNATTWFTGEEAVAAGLATECTAVQAAALVDRSKWSVHNTYVSAEQLRAAAETPEGGPVMPEIEDAGTPGPTVQPVPVRVTTHARAEAPYPHLLGAANPGRYSLFADIRAQGTDHEAAERIREHMALIGPRNAVTTAEVPPVDPRIDQGYFYQTVYDPTNPVSGIVSTGSLPTPALPFYIPSYTPTGNAGTGEHNEADLVNPHVEGVEPVLGDLGTFHRRLVEPGAVSGKIALTREAFLASTTPRMESLSLARMEVARRRAIEVSLAQMLDGMTGITEITIPRATPVDGVVNMLADMTYQVDAGRFNRLVLERGTYGDLVNAKDTTGRRLLAIDQAENNDGTIATSQTGLRNINVAGITGAPVAGLTHSYLIDTSVVWLLLGEELNFQFDYEVAWIRLGLYQTQCSFVVDPRGVRRILRGGA